MARKVKYKCTRCKVIKAASEFHPDKRKISGRQSWCKQCMAFNSKRHYHRDPKAQVEKAKQWARENPDRRAAIKRRQRFAQYGITEQDFHVIVESQSGGCAICKRSDESLVVDHCHKTGAVRGALCQRCNKGIGLLQDDAEILLCASKYLENFR